MIPRLAAGALLALAAVAFSPARPAACPEPSATLLFHSCWNGGRADVLLLPEDLPVPAAPGAGARVVVTGAYTARENREGGLRKPVGLFVHRGRVINPNLGRMDGILAIDPAGGTPRLQHRSRTSLDGQTFNLGDLDQRRAFVARARALGLSVLQSHLLIVSGRVDVRPQENAPIFRRRILFTDSAGFGLYQTIGAQTLYDAATALEAALRPRMALNLDMGSYDFCLAALAGVEANCGALARGDIAKLSNLLVLSDTSASD